MLKIINDLEKINFAYIIQNDETIASIDFRNGTISKYQLNEGNRKIEVSIGNTITRNIERNFESKKYNSKTEIHDFKTIESDCKRLFKHL